MTLLKIDSEIAQAMLKETKLSRRDSIGPWYLARVIKSRCEIESEAFLDALAAMFIHLETETLLELAEAHIEGHASVYLSTDQAGMIKSELSANIEITELDECVPILDDYEVYFIFKDLIPGLSKDQIHEFCRLLIAAWYPITHDLNRKYNPELLDDIRSEVKNLTVEDFNNGT